MEAGGAERERKVRADSGGGEGGDELSLRFAGNWPCCAPGPQALGPVCGLSQCDKDISSPIGTD
jgi:hypothetical protein